MIYSLNGKLIEKQNLYAIIECGGVGYSVMMSEMGISKVGNVGDDVFVYIYMVIKEDDISLFGFVDIEERNCFKNLISVSGVGIKVAQAILSAITPGEFATSVITGDYSNITKANGVGPKLAQRIILELKDKISKENISMPQTTASAPMGTGAKSAEIIGALMALGYTQYEAKRAIGKIDINNLGVEDAIKVALNQLMN